MYIVHWKADAFCEMDTEHCCKIQPDVTEIGKSYISDATVVNFFALWDFSVSTMRFFCNILRLSRRHGMFFATPETSTELHISFDPAMLWIPPTDGSESKCLLWLRTLLIFGLLSSNQRSVSLCFCIFYISDNKEMPWGQIFDPFQDIKCDSTAYL